MVVRLPQALAEHAGRARELTLDVAASSTLGEVLDVLRRDAPAVGRRVQDETGATVASSTCTSERTSAGHWAD